MRAGISDDVEDAQPLRPPIFSTLVNKMVEVCWPYWGPDGKKQLIWSSGKVVMVADGVSHKETAKSRKILPAGAVLFEWEADDKFDESAGQQWLILDPVKWNKQTQMAWRYDPSELAAAAQPRSPGQPARSRARRA